MSEAVTTILAAQNEPTPEPVKTAQAETKSEEFVYEYQPKDAEGRPLGGKQVIKAKDIQEALDKMANQNQELIRLNRKMKQDQLLGIKQDEEDKIPEDAERGFDDDLDFSPKALTAADKLQFARDMGIDPERVEPVAEKFSEILFGQKPDKVRNILKRASTDIAATRSHAEAVAFREAHPEFYNSMDNIKVLVSLLKKEGLRPTKQNFEIVYSRATKAGLLFAAPEVAEVNNPTETLSEDESTTRISEPETSQQKRPVRTSSGLKGNGSPTGGTGGRSRGYTKAEIDQMSAEEYKRLVAEPERRRLLNNR